MQLVETPPDPEQATKRRRASTRAQAVAVPAETPATEIAARPVAAAPKPRRTRKSTAAVAAEAEAISATPVAPAVEAVAPPVEAVSTPEAAEAVSTPEAAPETPGKSRRTRKSGTASAASSTPEATPTSAAAPEAPAPKPRRTRKAAATVEAVPTAEASSAPTAADLTTSAMTEPASAPAKPRRTRKTRVTPVAEAAASAPVQPAPAPVQVAPEPAAAPAKPRRTRQAAREAAAARAAEAAAAVAMPAEAAAAAEPAVAPAPAAAPALAAAPVPAVVDDWVPTVTRVRIVDGREERYEVPVGSDGPRKRRKVRRVRPAAEADTYAGPTPLDPGPSPDEPKVLAFGGVLMTAQTARSLADMGFVNPTEIQQKTIPLLLEGQDVVGQAQTGTGKTAAFGIPLVERIDPSMLVVQALVLAPTRELASQISDELTRIGRWRGVHVAAIYGGASMGNQLRDLKRGAQVVVGTPGRILDHLKRGTLSFESVSYLVLDEADRMLDMGFMPDVERILRRTPRNRQTALFSATVPTVVRIISRRHMRDAVTVQCKPEQPTVAAVDQVYYEVAERDKPEALRTVLLEEQPERAMIFCRTQVAVDRLTRILRRDGIPVEAIHGSLGQNQRERVLADFRSGAITLLIATNLAARGLDIPEVSHVINYDIPEESESYVHRIGRTARMGREGKAITFVAEWDEKSLSEIKKVTNGALREERLSLYA
ncbi:MAG: DEAD/DEAH box helicase [Chloroflexi bacterium]|nr:DEAD/DEAH box helicase [Chloroflexota bacterium]